MLSLQRLILQSFCYFWVKIESILRTSDLWQKLCCCIGKSFWVHQKMCGSRKCPYSPHGRDRKFQGVEGGGDSQRSCMYVEMYEAYMLLEFLGGWGGGLRINPFCGGGMDNLWSYTIWIFGHYFHCRDKTCHSINAPNILIFFSMQK